MHYVSVSEKAKEWSISERSVRNYCSQGKIPGAFIVGKTWSIPSDAVKPSRETRFDKKNTLLDILKREMESRLHGGIYHHVQIDLTYNSNHIEGSTLTHDQTRFIFETNTIGVDNEAINVDDIIETANHFKCIDLIIKEANSKLSEAFIKKLHFLLKSGTKDSTYSWFNVGEYKKLPNEVGLNKTTSPSNVPNEMKHLLVEYNSKTNVNLEDIISFHQQFESIHPFQDGNGRVGRLIMFKECLKHSIVPFIITEYYKAFYYRGLQEWNREKGYLLDTCLSAQDKFKQVLDYFEIEY